MRPFTQAANFLFAVFLLVSAAHAIDPVFNIDGKAIRGSDPVAYFTEEKPVKGSPGHTYACQGATWQFASVENRQKFIGDPAKYAPAYGGYCAWAAAQNKTAPGKAEYWAIVDDKLYLNFSKKVQDDWNEDRSGFITKADENWPDLLK